ncbi:hypothetical protein NC653_030305 [Populus alba x Populus x berolinensis]|uniref:Uncharacterized protein n=1 Tax=Populus alba x Populus x berolinensis TaxID=444605 RepID=A0AAD6Q049_9ROSI|nr:hypothetical protein NC653_030305 [Populus alba x Populus x berolinensis]
MEYHYVDNLHALVKLRDGCGFELHLGKTRALATEPVHCQPSCKAISQHSALSLSLSLSPPNALQSPYFPGKIPARKHFPEKHARHSRIRQLSSSSLHEYLTTTITDLISNQNWSRLKTRIQNTGPNTLLQQSLDFRS